MPGLRIMPLSSEHDAYSILNEAQANRSVAEHRLNRKSSRSHVIYTYYVTRTRYVSDNNNSTKSDDLDPEVMQTKIHLVDLAGSERMNKTGSTGSVQKEANYINKSLSYLEQVVIALTQSKREHIPYRQSKLTYLLKDSLGGNCNTFMIACVWPDVSHNWESLSTLRLAARMKCIETNPIRNNLINKEAPSSKLLSQIDILKKEIAMRDFVSGKESSWLPELTQNQKLKTYSQCWDVLRSTPPSPRSGEDLSISNLEVQSLSHLNLIIGVLKTTLWEHCQNDIEEVKNALKSTLTTHNTSQMEEIEEIFKFHEKPKLTNNSSKSQIINKNFQELDNTSIRSPNTSNYEYEEPKENKRSKEETEKLFEQFKLGIGKSWNNSYEDTKETLKLSKTRQKEIIILLNSQKAIIDNLTSELSQFEDVDRSDGNRQVIKDIEIALDDAKRSYRSAHNEFQLCKEQITETQSLKKRAMVSLLNAFSEYENSI